MVSLVDLAPLKETITVRGKSFELSGIPAFVIVDLLVEFPELRRIFAEKELRQNELAALIAGSGRLAGALIAAANGEYGNEEAMRNAARLPPGDMLPFIAPILRLTFPQGVRAFVEEVAALLPRAVGESGWVVAGKSQVQSKPASATATPQTPHGGIPQGNSEDGQKLSSANVKEEIQNF